MHKYSKTLDLSDYSILPTDFVNKVYSGFSDICRFEHDHRRWEYGLALQALLDNESKNVLEVGGGGSLLIPLVYLKGMEVIEVDPWDCSGMLLQQKVRLGLLEDIRFFQEDFLDFNIDEQFDAVVCTSVIEHVPEHEKFFQKLLSYVKPDGILVLTTDFHPSGEQFSQAHLRTYSEKDLLAYANSAKGFDFLGDGYDYTFWGNYVYQYTFGSLVLKNG